MKSPCISICKFDRNICRGCGRSKAEIKTWKKLGKAEQRAVLALADMRLLALSALPRSKN